MASRLCFNIGFLIVASVGLLHGAYAANTYTVGGDLGWIVPPNNTYYEEWTSQRTFQIGDTFVFNWTTGTHTATEVSTKEEYDNCTKMGMILAFAGVKVTFNENGTHYFLCSEGTHCEQGQKMIIKIGDGIPPSFAAPSLTAAAALSALFFSTLAIFFLN
ncbi:umecyanin-like [Populus nigra]|uniref:umecyanin-like n=1 Tax=Populus nigra TaxID=3691 RepID=UPI002B275218|nr:umecyanin-like [Populus nigra]